MIEAFPSSEEPTTEFTPAQREALYAGGKFVDEFRSLSVSRLPEGFDPYTDKIPVPDDATDLERAHAGMRMIGHTYIMHRDEASDDTWGVSCHFNPPDIQPLSQQLPDELLTNTFAAYHTLPSDYVGMVSHGPQDGHISDIYTVYSVESSGTPGTENSGVIVSAHISESSRVSSPEEPAYDYTLLDAAQINTLSDALQNVVKNGEQLR